MHRSISLLLATAAVLIVFGTVSKFAEANRAIFSAGSQDELEQAKQISLDILRSRATLRAIGSPDDYKIKRVEIDGLKMAHTHVQQVIGGIPVWEGEAIVHLASDGSLSSITDELKDAVAINTTPNLSARRAMRLAVDSYDGKAQLSDSPTADLYIYRGQDRDHLVWRVVTPRVDGSDATSIPVYFIDAHTGDLVDQYDNLQTGTGTPLYYNGGQATTINTSSSGSTFYMEDLTRKQGTINMNSTGNETYGTGGTQSRYSGTDDIWGEATGSKERAAVDAHIGAAKTFDYYKNVHGRNGIDGNYGPGSTTAGASSTTSLLVSRVHFGSSGRYNNAFWNGTTMSYGDGDGTNFTPLTTLDICGHEMTHGVTERSAGLTYSKESGALNESWSDVMGSMVELYANGGTVTTGTWLIGEQAYTPGIAGDALRSMKDPHSVGDPDHYSLRLYPASCTASSSNDNCGVHTNSSISNHAYYLIAAGGTNRVSGVSVTGIGTSAAEKIWYRALTVYMTASTNFAGARTATLNAASDLFGSSSTQYNGVATGWCAVGVGSCPSGTPSPTPTATATATPTPTPTVTPTPTPTPSSELVTNGSFEVSQSPWISSGSGFFYTASNTYPHTGTGYIYMGVNNNTAGSVYQTVTIPSTATAAMTFWLNVVSSETTTSTQYDKLYVEVRDTSNRLLKTVATYSNLNKAAAGAYSQKSFSLAAYRGRTVRLQFRWTTDVSLSTTFRVDDVSLK